MKPIEFEQKEMSMLNRRFEKYYISNELYKPKLPMFLKHIKRETGAL